MESEVHGAYKAHKERIENSISENNSNELNENAHRDLSAAALQARADLARINSKLGKLWYRVKYGLMTKLAVIIAIFLGCLLFLGGVAARASANIPLVATIVLYATVIGAGLAGLIMYGRIIRKSMQEIPKELW